MNLGDAGITVHRPTAAFPSAGPISEWAQWGRCGTEAHPV